MKPLLPWTSDRALIKQSPRCAAAKRRLRNPRFGEVLHISPTDYRPAPETGVDGQHPYGAVGDASGWGAACGAAVGGVEDTAVRHHQNLLGGVTRRNLQGRRRAAKAGVAVGCKREFQCKTSTIPALAAPTRASAARWSTRRPAFPPSVAEVV
jgi:hypothetical protein